MRFNIGDIVTIVQWNVPNQAFGVNSNMKEFQGHTGAIHTKRTDSLDRSGYRVEGSHYIWEERCLALATEVPTDLTYRKIINKIKSLQEKRND